MFPVARVTGLTNKGDKIVTGSNVMFVDPTGGGAPSISVNVNGSIYTYTAEEVEAQGKDDDFDRPGVNTNATGASDDGAQDSDTNLNNNLNGVDVNCGNLSGNVGYDTQLSLNFKLSDLTTKAVFSHKLVAQRGLTVAQIVCNLKNVAENCLEPLVQRYGRKNMIITSGFRQGSSGSQHCAGEAVDVQFANFSVGQYFTEAQTVQNLVPFDQYILEYHGNNPVWHFSYRKSRLRKQVLTTKDLIKYYPGLHKFR